MGASNINTAKSGGLNHMNMSTPTLGSTGNALSMAVKLKLKNAILQKQDRDKMAKSISNIHEANSGRHQPGNAINVTRSQNYLHESKQNGSNLKHSFHSNLNDIVENKVAVQQYRQKFNGECLRLIDLLYLKLIEH
jgi:hypothetical protein